MVSARVLHGVMGFVLPVLLVSTRFLGFFGIVLWWFWGDVVDIWDLVVGAAAEESWSVDLGCYVA